MFFFTKNVTSISTLVKDVFDYYTRDYTFEISKHGSVVNDVWVEDVDFVYNGVDTNEEFLNFNDEEMSYSYIQPNTYGHQSRVSSRDDYVPTKSLQSFPSTNNNSNSIVIEKSALVSPIQDFVDRNGSNVSVDKVSKMDLIQRLISFYQNKYRTEPDALTAFHYLGYAVANVCPDQVTSEFVRTVYTGARPFGFPLELNSQIEYLIRNTHFLADFSVALNAFLVKLLPEPWKGDDDKESLF